MKAEVSPPASPLTRLLGSGTVRLAVLFGAVVLTLHLTGWTPGWLGVLSLLTAGALIWAWLLRRRLQEQTGMLLQRLQRVAGLEETYRELFEKASDMVFTCDPQGGFTSLNAEGERLTGYTQAEALRLRLGDLVPPPHAEHARQLLGEGARPEGGQTVELELESQQGRRVPVSIRMRPLMVEGRVVGLHGIARDITERQRAEKELEQAKHAAEAANRAKSEFLANMSHEIRTPMNGIIGMTELALDTLLDRQQREYLEMVKESADSLLTLINDILDFSKIEAGKLTLDVMDFKLPDNLTHTLRSLAPRAHQKGLELAYEIAPEVPVEVRGDPTRLRQVLINLVGNAIKFTARGEILLRVTAEGVTDEDARLRFEVRDTGIGIPADKQREIFDAFAQADGSMTRRYGGTGLGLAISRQLVELMGGRLEVESTVGQGSTFHFSARLERSPATAEAEPLAAEAPDLRGLRVLVVDDNATNRRLLDAMLRHWEMLPELAAGGTEGVALMTESRQAGRPFPLVLVDAQMPDMDGFSLAEKIKHDPQLAAATIMMLTSAGQRGDAARCRDLGIDAYLVKPIRRSDLLDAIQMVLGRKKASPVLVTRHVLREARQRLRVLVVEDNPVNQRLAARLLEREGHAVTLAGNGREALEKLEGTDGKFDVVVMDVQMPEMDGLRATGKIRAREKMTGRHLPVVAMTARAMKGDRERCRAAGMDGYVAKPLQARAFLAEIEAACSGASGASAERHVPVPRAQLLSRVGGDVELLAEMARLFEGNAGLLLEALREAAERGDTESLQFAAHQLRGSAANFDAQGVCAAADELENLGRRGNLDGAAGILQKLQEEMAKLLTELKQLRREGGL